MMGMVGLEGILEDLLAKAFEEDFLAKALL